MRFWAVSASMSFSTSSAISRIFSSASWVPGMSSKAAFLSHSCGLETSRWMVLRRLNSKPNC